VIAHEALVRRKPLTSGGSSTQIVAVAVPGRRGGARHLVRDRSAPPRTASARIRAALGGKHRRRHAVEAAGIGYVIARPDRRALAFLALCSYNEDIELLEMDVSRLPVLLPRFGATAEAALGALPRKIAATAMRAIGNIDHGGRRPVALAAAEIVRGRRHLSRDRGIVARCSLCFGLDLLSGERFFSFAGVA
jgi:hypothetical protein